VRKKREMDVRTAVIASRGNISNAALLLGCSRQTLYERLKDNAELRAIIDDFRQSLVDTAETRLADAVERGEAWAVRLVLTTLGKSRGWTAEPDKHHSGPVDVRIVDAPSWRVIDSNGEVIAE